MNTAPDSSLPLVSCIMPTRNRRQFVSRAIQYFLRQSYPNKELVIVDDGTDRVGDLVPSDLRIRYFELPGCTSTGAKRNIACQNSKGTLIAHWDDDDWYASWRLTYQVEQMLKAKADICGLDRVLFYAPEEEKVWEYIYPPEQRPWVYGASLCYTRSFFETHPFADIRLGEDTCFVWADPRARVHPLRNCQFMIAIVHGENTSPKLTSDSRYITRAVGDIETLVGADRPFYATWRGDAQHRPMQSDSGKRRALISAAQGIGDILRVTPLIRVAYGLGFDVDVLLATDYPEVAQLLAGAPEINRLIQVQSIRGGSGAIANNWQQSLPGEIADTEYEVAAFTAWSAPMCKAVRARRALAFDHARWLAEGDSRSVERIARNMGWQGDMPEPFAIASRTRFDLPPGTVAIHPGCKAEWPWKKWHGYEDLAERFRSVAVVGTQEDLVTQGTYFQHNFKWPDHAQNFVGRLTLADTAALLRQCAALVSNDSGLMQLGAVLGIPTFGIFGITSPEREGMQLRNFYPITKGLPCELACHTGSWGRRDCEYHLRCLKTLTADEVLQRVLEKVPDIATRLVEQSCHPASVEVRKPLEVVHVAAEITGGIGDVVLAAQLLLNLQLVVPECRIEVFYHTPETAQFVFHHARFVRAVHSPAGFADAARRCDLILRIHSLAKCEIRDMAKLRRVDSDFADRLEEAIRRFGTFEGFFREEPQFDSLWGRVCVRHGYDRLTSLGWLAGLAIGAQTPLFLAPDPAAYDFFQRWFPEAFTPYVTIHDGFDNHVRLAPGAATKCWPLEHWIALICRLKAAKPELKIVQLGSRNSRPIPGVDMNLVQRTSLSEAAWFIKHARVHIDGDSGLVHMARALHTPSVVLFGPTDDQYFGHSQNVNLRAPGCANCWWSTPTWLSRCPRGLPKPECMTAIEPDRVSNAALQIIENRRIDRGNVVATAVYGHPGYGELDEILGAIFDAAHLIRTPISQHAWSPNAGIYLHASKQWEYLFAWQQSAQRFGGGVAGKRIADIGGGRGAWAAFLARRGAHVEPFDVDYLWDNRGDTEIESHFFRWARNHRYQPRFGSLFNLPIETASIDIVTSISVVEHLRHKRYAIMEALRVLKPGGLLILTFDLSLAPEKHQDALRQEIFSPQSLDRTLTELGICPAGIPTELIAESATRIQQDRVLGIPVGMTVGGIAIVKTNHCYS
jgi:ADP-heptose:LPS heptosyltransferase/SAM-dependent methyltransferase